MSTWRQKAIECAPELKSEFEVADLTPYTVFMELLPVTKQAHIDNEHEKLAKIYAFAEWCHKQKNENLWNAVGVCFYEHLADSDETFLQFTNWIKKEIYTEIRELLLHRASNEQIKKLDSFYGFTKKR